MFVIRLSEASVFRSILRGPDDFESTRFSCSFKSYALDKKGTDGRTHGLTDRRTSRLLYATLRRHKNVTGMSILMCMKNSKTLIHKILTSIHVADLQILKSPEC